jgi:RecB family exonuclease
MVEHGIDAVPFSHPDLDKWRANFQGVQCLHKPTNFIVTGAIDDVWINQSGELIVVDYKATATSKEILLDDSDYKQKLKNQIDVYQWLLRQNGFKVSNTGYFIYCNGDDTKESFGGKLDFSISVLPYVGDDSWVEPTLIEIRTCLEADTIPATTKGCAFCGYWAAVKSHVDRVPEV